MSELIPTDTHKHTTTYVRIVRHTLNAGCSIDFQTKFTWVNDENKTMTLVKNIGKYIVVIKTIIAPMIS